MAVTRYPLSMFVCICLAHTTQWFSKLQWACLLSRTVDPVPPSLVGVCLVRRNVFSRCSRLVRRCNTPAGATEDYIFISPSIIGYNGRCSIIVKSRYSGMGQSDGPRMEQSWFQALPNSVLTSHDRRQRKISPYQVLIVTTYHGCC